MVFGLKLSCCSISDKFYRNVERSEQILSKCELYTGCQRNKVLILQYMDISEERGPAVVNILLHTFCSGDTSKIN